MGAWGKAGVAFVSVALTVLAGAEGAAQAEDFSYTCTGIHVAHRNSDPVASRETVTLRAQDDAILVGLPGAADPMQAETLSDNRSALILRVDGMTVQYMRLTNNLFVIHDDGRLTRLECVPGR